MKTNNWNYSHSWLVKKHTQELAPGFLILPGYSPELNPDETVWAYVKHHVVGKKIITGPDQFLKVVKEALYGRVRIFV